MAMFRLRIFVIVFIISLVSIGMAVATPSASSHTSGSYRQQVEQLMPPPPVDFAPAVHYGGQQNQVGWAGQGDINRDGYIDFAVPNWYGYQMIFYMGAPDGTFTRSSFSTGSSNPFHAELADLDNDTDLDLVVTYRFDQTIVIYLGNGAGSFSFKQSYAAATEPVMTRAADLNNDGNLDLVTSIYRSNQIRVRLGTGGANFAAPVAYTVGSMPYDLTVGDLDANGTLDLVVTNDGSASISVLRGNGNGTFAAAVSYPGVGANPRNVSLGDVNEDGILDIAVASAGATSDSDIILFGSGTGAFSVGASLPGPPGSGSNSALLKDINYDSHLDLLRSHGHSGQITVQLGNGNGTFTLLQTYAVQTNPLNLSTGDFNGDGLFDLAVPNYGSATFSVLLGRPVAGPTPTATSTLTATATATELPTATVTATATATSTLTATATATATELPTVTATATATELPTATATATATELPTSTPTATATPGGSPRMSVFLPLMLHLQPRLLVAINPEIIPIRPISKPGEIYYTTTFALSAPLPAAGRFYLSSAPDRVAAVTVDDELAIIVNGQEVYVRMLTNAQIVEFPRSLLESWDTQPVTVIFRDAYGSVVGSSPVWLIWTP